MQFYIRVPYLFVCKMAVYQSKMIPNSGSVIIWMWIHEIVLEGKTPPKSKLNKTDLDILVILERGTGVYQNGADSFH